MKNKQDEDGFRMRDAPIKDFFVCENAGVVLQDVFWIFLVSGPRFCRLSCNTPSVVAYRNYKL